MKRSNVERVLKPALLCLAVLLMTALACGVKAGDNSPARPGGETLEFHRSPVTAFEQFRIDLAITDAVCTADPSDVTVTMGQRVRLAIQLPGEIRQGITKSLEVVGERIQVNYTISGLEISSSGGAFATGIKEVNLDMESGARQSYDFNPAATGDFDILCNDDKVGVFTVNPA